MAEPVDRWRSAERGPSVQSVTGLTRSVCSALTKWRIEWTNACGWLVEPG
jgi:hypothetical protein